MRTVGRKSWIQGFNKTLVAGILMFGSLFASFGFAGFGDGTAGTGGGVGVRCEGKLKSLDRYEAELQGIKLKNPQTLLEAFEIIERSYNGTVGLKEKGWRYLDDNPFYHFIRMEGDYALPEYEIKKQENLPLTNDWGRIKGLVEKNNVQKLPDNCQFEQIIIFQDKFRSEERGIALVDPIKFRELDLIDKILLSFHELLYIGVRWNAFEESIENLGIKIPITSETVRQMAVDLVSRKHNLDYAKTKIGTYKLPKIKVKIIPQKLKNIICDELGVDLNKLEANDSLVDDLGADNLDMSELIYTLEEKYKIDISDEVAEVLITVSDIATYLQSIGKLNY